jgi:hypothetical protein
VLAVEPSGESVLRPGSGALILEEEEGCLIVIRENDRREELGMSTCFHHNNIFLLDAAP